MIIIVSFCLMFVAHSITIFFFFNDTATTEIYTLSLHDALPICFALDDVFEGWHGLLSPLLWGASEADASYDLRRADRKSTRLNSSHLVISYAVFCLKKKNNTGTSGRLRRSTRRSGSSIRRTQST